MTQTETLLWNKLKSFQPDETDVRLTFSQRLARENGWDLNYTHRVIEEYKKFLFLCCISPTPVTPSDPVDQAWHLHLTYTRSYWNDLCKNTLEREIHHTPTKGGIEEQQKFDGLYTALHQIYFEKFGINPPPDIWQDNDTRFNDINFQRVNLSRYWLVKKPRLKPTLLWVKFTGIGTVSLLIQASGQMVVTFIVFSAIIAIINHYNDNDKGRKGGNNGSGGGCSDFSCASDSHGHSGCSSHGGDSGCSSGCGGCGGGD